MKKTLLFTFCIAILITSYTTVKASEIETPVAGFANVLDKLNTVDLPIYRWTTGKVNLRKEASTSSDIIITLDKRVKVQKITSSGEWIKVKCDTYVGYIHSDYLRNTELFTSKNNRWGIDLTEDEIELLAKIVWIESRGEPDSGSAGVVNVVFNRMVSLDYPDSLYEVLSQDDQFTSWELRNDAKPTEREFEIIEETLRGEYDILSMGVMYFSTSPRNDNIERKIGNHWFCKED